MRGVWSQCLVQMWWEVRKPFTARVSELQFADDLAAVGTSRESMESAACVLDDLLLKWGLTLSNVKTKLLVAGDSDRIAKASKAFGALREPIFRDSKLSGVKSAERSSEVTSQPWEATGLPFMCDTCQRAFRRRKDIARHRCVTTRPKGQVASRPPVLSSM